MNFWKINIGLLVWLFLTSNVTHAQELAFTQFYTSTTFSNPSTAGLAYGPRIMATYRNQYPNMSAGLNGGYVNYFISYDQHFEAISGGIGVYILAEEQASGIYKKQELGLTYAYQLRASRNFGIKMAATGLLKQQRLNWDQLQFIDQIDPIYGFFTATGQPNSTNETVPENLDIFEANAGSSLLFFSSRHYGGLSIKNVLPFAKGFYQNQSFKGQIAINLQYGSIFPLKSRNKEQLHYVSPNIMFTNQQNFRQVNAGIITKIDYLYFGTFFKHTLKHSDAVSLIFGFRKKTARIAYSYDLAVGKRLLNSGGSHELTLAIKIKGDDNSLYPNNRQGILICPDLLTF